MTHPKPFYTPRLGRAVMAALADDCDLSVRQITGSSRRGYLARARQLITAVMLDVFDVSLEDLGALMDRHHTTVIHSRDTIESLCITHADMQQERERLGEVARAAIASAQQQRKAA